MAALFARFGSLRGWSLPEIALLYAMVSLAFALTDGLARGFDGFSLTLKAGDFDRLLLRPRSTVLQLAGSELVLKRIGRILQASCILTWASHALHLIWTPAQCLLLAAAVLGGASLFFGLFVIQATVSFWTIESLEVMNAFTYGGCETAQYPLSIYQPWFRKFFTYVVPLACISYYPALALLGHVRNPACPPSSPGSRPLPASDSSWLRCGCFSSGCGIIGLRGVRFKSKVRSQKAKMSGPARGASAALLEVLDG